MSDANLSQVSSNRWESHASILLMFLAVVGALWLLVIPLFAPIMQQQIGWRILDWRVDGETRLRWILSIVPAVFLVNHALFLAVVRARQIPTVASRPLADSSDPILAPSVNGEWYFSGPWLTFRYGLPAVMSVVLCSTVIAALSRPEQYWCCTDSWNEWPNILRGARDGFAGAYIYIVLMLTQRTFRRDVTSGIALWSVAMLVLGPALAGVVALIWAGSTPPAGDQWTRDAVYFVAGMAPRQFATILQQAAQRMIMPNAERTSARVVALNQVEGITPELEERLAEEGITDVATLSVADPFVLLRTTSFDRRQIASWIDEALLIVWLPDSWQKLQSLGIPGAIDLAWHHKNAEALEVISRGSGIDLPILRSTVQRMFEDAQIRIVWTLYQLDSASEFDPGEDDDEDLQSKQEANELDSSTALPLTSMPRGEKTA